jgi:hypothetical protein
MSRWKILLSAAGLLIATQAHAETRTFTANLTGTDGPYATGSKATGKARIAVDLKARTVSLWLDVRGLTREALWDRLVAAPIGPIHLHKYGKPLDAHDHSGAGVVLIMPVPYGGSYKATRRGFAVVLKDYPFATGSALLGSTLDFDNFIAALDSRAVVLNIHTDAYNDGEISGTIIAR